MSYTTPHVAGLQRAIGDFQKALEEFCTHADSKSWIQAAIQVGRMQENAKTMFDRAKFLEDATWQDSRSFHGEKD